MNRAGRLAVFVLAPLFPLFAACSGSSDDHAPTGATTDSGSDTGDGGSGAPDAGSFPALTSFIGGTNLSALEFNSAAQPGKPNIDYGVPTHAEVDYFVGKGMRFFRLPFLWERMQPTLGGDFDPTYLGFVTDLAGYATSKGATVLIDLHNYARYKGLVIDGTDKGAATTAQFGAFWGKLAALFKNDPKVVFGLTKTLTAFTRWAKANGKRAMIGEFGVANNATCLANLESFLGYVDQNRDVFAGWTYWSAGPWWGPYMYSIEPSSTGADAPQLATLLKHL